MGFSVFTFLKMEANFQSRIYNKIEFEKSNIDFFF